MGFHFGAALAQLVTVGVAFAMVALGWKVFRGVVSLAMGAASGALAFALVAVLVGYNGGSLGSSLQAGALLGLLGFVAGVAVGLRAQQLCAAVGTFSLTGTLAAGLTYALGEGQQGAGSDPRGLALVVGLVVGLAMAALVNAFYDVVAAALMASLVTGSFVPSRHSVLASLLEESDPQRGLFTLLLESLRELSRSVWAAVVVPLWAVGFAVTLRLVAWTPRTAEREPALLPTWRGALLGASFVVAVDGALTRCFNFPELAGTYPLAWPALVVALHRLHARLRGRSPAPSTLDRYLRHLALVLLVSPLLHAVALVLVRDLPSFQFDPRFLASTRYLGTYFAGFVVVDEVLHGRLETAGALTFALSLKWAVNLVVMPALLEAGYGLGADAPAERVDVDPRRAGAVVLVGLTGFAASLLFNLHALRASPDRAARAAMVEQPLRGLCQAPVPAAATGDRPLARVEDADLLRLIFPGYDPAARRNRVARVEEVSDGERRVTWSVDACGGLAVHSNSRGAVGTLLRAPLSVDRLFVRAVTLSEPAAGSDELTGVLAVVGARGRELVVHAIAPWTGQTDTLQGARAERMGGQVVYVLPSFSADGNDGSSTGEEVWMDRDGRLSAVGGYTLRTREMCSMNNLPWDDHISATPTFVPEGVRLVEEHRFEQAPCADSVPGLRVAPSRVVVTRTYELRDGRLQERGTVRVPSPAPPPAWVEYVRREMGDDVAREIAPNAPAPTPAPPAPPAPPPAEVPAAPAPPAPAPHPAAAPAPIVADRWDEDAERYKHREGERFRYQCPARGHGGHAVGPSPYATISSVCESAVHAGVIQREEGGVVTVLIGPPLRRFERSTQNGVSSRYSNRRRFSFTFVR